MSATRPCSNKKFYIYSDGTHKHRASFWAREQQNTVTTVHSGVCSNLWPAASYGGSKRFQCLHSCGGSAGFDSWDASPPGHVRHRTADQYAQFSIWPHEPTTSLLRLVMCTACLTMAAAASPPDPPATPCYPQSGHLVQSVGQWEIVKADKARALHEPSLNRPLSHDKLIHT